MGVPGRRARQQEGSAGPSHPMQTDRRRQRRRQQRTTTTDDDVRPGQCPLRPSVVAEAAAPGGVSPGGVRSVVAGLEVGGAPRRGRLSQRGCQAVRASRTDDGGAAEQHSLRLGPPARQTGVECPLRVVTRPAVRGVCRGRPPPPGGIVGRTDGFFVLWVVVVGCGGCFHTHTREHTENEGKNKTPVRFPQRPSSCSTYRPATTAAT